MDFFLALALAVEREIEMEELEPRLGIYNQEEREKRLELYRERRKNRGFGPFKYTIRGGITKKRPRIGGRFVKKLT